MGFLTAGSAGYHQPIKQQKTIFMKLYNIKNKADLDQAVKENTSPLWNFRLGRNPFRSTGRKELSEEERVLLGRRLAESRKNS